MTRTLTEDIKRGERAIVLARNRGLDTARWEAALADLKRRALLAWASELAEQDRTLRSPVEYTEAPLRKVTTTRVSWYAARYLKTISAAHLYQEHPQLSWGLWTPEWWKDREEEALGALAALRKALGEHGHDD